MLNEYGLDEARFDLNCGSIQEYERYLGEHRDLLSARARLEQALVPKCDLFFVRGYCAVCKGISDFRVDFLHAEPQPTGARRPNWRERLICPMCRLPNRQRAMIDFLLSSMKLSQDAALYVTEQTTAFFRKIAALYPNAFGSELLRDGTPLGEMNSHRVRSEDVTRLTFADASLDAVCTADVLEHVPDYELALSEFYRTLKIGAPLVLSVPFLVDAASTVVRARIGADGSIEYLLPPEYHGDPLDKQGVLCYYHFGWDLLEALRRAGFVRPAVYFYWSARRGYLGGMQLLISARKAGGPTQAMT